MKTKPLPVEKGGRPGRLNLDSLLTTGEKRDAAAYASRLAWLIALTGLLFFWAGLHYMDERFFPHRFNPSRHIIIEQDPDTYELHAWRDSFGRVYTPADAQVRLFPYAAGGLILFILVLGTGIHHLLVQHYKMLLLIKSERWQQAVYSPEWGRRHPGF
ncbi:hypothetical protein [Desulfotomaculum copahuensis]|uniref:Uncharacterized protein n=1 Tax=Desulfotomaculum copahuensis TaxID=1838280 RepID=A0A1B7LD20_9FIRM|nr:hypothetical protein [Desulfotomaculum copahuensis]OAT80812.1 hypothetical protein A6M21_12535 [Desulfotomaculum copahuensis]